MARDRLGSEYSENMSDATTYTCTTNSCSLRSCTDMFQEPFFLHPPGTRPRDGIYINPMSPFISENQKPKDSESFYLHSPHDLVYTRITRLFCDSVDKTRNVERNGIERKDETVTVKVDVHINNGSIKSVSNGNSIKSDVIKEPDHAYEQICIRQDETESVKSGSNKKFSDDASESSRSRTTGRRFSRSSSGSESSHLSSEIACYSSTSSTPSLSRKSSNERINKIPKAPELPDIERKSTTPQEGEKDLKIIIEGPSIVKPPPPPPPPPPPDSEESISPVKLNEPVEKDIKNESKSTPAANKSDTSSDQSQQAQTEVVAVLSASTDSEDVKSNQVSHLVNKHMVLPFIPPQFSNAANSDTLLKPSEYLRSICKTSNKNSLSKARSVDNLDIQGRLEEAEVDKGEEEKVLSPGPPPPPLPPPLLVEETLNNSPVTPPSTTSSQEPESPKPHQPLATISIQDLTSVQLRRTNIKMHATKTFSAPPNRSVSMTNVSESFFVQKTDLIAELKKTKDIPGIKKFKVEMAKVEKTQEQNLISEITKNFSVSNFVDQIPEKDSSGNVIPIWKRQMLARKAAERAKKEMEEQIARENEEKRQKAIPPWKRQLLAKKETSDDKEKEKKTPPVQPTPLVVAPPPVKIDLISPLKKDVIHPIKPPQQLEDKVEIEDKKVLSRDQDSDDDAPIIPWRAQLRKTNSKLSILD
ncbi:nucleolar protein dao-5 isoform X2 [Chelonus insularis]|uniref:nucleolar protein dao-5 isoform X2 n=1 Tax=Chelonus insularis TaxID=460826 RepID=UPI00158C04DB|nr:nucleolar protein dao-5-like isoform X2 [Chelonus insularis]XP_034952138.1 nucleolar protein dao-5-like isoform X2 [Chelonus insularis]